MLDWGGRGIFLNSSCQDLNLVVRSCYLANCVKSFMLYIDIVVQTQLILKIPEYYVAHLVYLLLLCSCRTQETWCEAKPL